MYNRCMYSSSKAFISLEFGYHKDGTESTSRFSLIIPVVTGLGLNFGIVLGAMAAQIALVAVTHWEIGISGFIVTALLSVPLSIFFGWLTGRILNRAKGNEMITSMMLGFLPMAVSIIVFIRSGRHNSYGE